MPTARIPLVGNINRRPYLAATNTSYDQRFEGCLFESIPNTATGGTSWYVIKHPTDPVDKTISGAGALANDIFYSPSRDNFYGAWGATNSTVYYYVTSTQTETSLGTITGLVNHFSEALIGSVTYLLMSSSDGTGWYHASNAITSFTGNTNTNTVIDGIASTTGLYPGQAISGTGIVAGTRIATITSATAITVDTATTGTATVAITVTPVAKQVSANFPTLIIGGFVEMNGAVFIMTTQGRVYNSDLNNPAAWTANNYITADSVSDGGIGLGRIGERIAAFGPFSIDYFDYKGNSTGSLLSKAGKSIKGIGATSAANSAHNAGARALIASGHDNCFFVSQDGILYGLEGLTPKRLSTQADYQLEASTCIGTFSIAGKRIVHLADNVGQGAGTKYRWFDLDTGFITIPSLSSGSTCVAGPNISHVCYSATRSGSNGQIRIIRDDNSATFGTLTIQTSKINHGTQKRKIVKNLRIDADTQASGTLTVEYSDDDYATWVTWGTIDMTLPKKEITRGGSYKGNRAYRFTHSANTSFRASTIEIDYEECAA